MTMDTVIINARLAGTTRSDHYIIIHDRRIADVGTGPLPSLPEGTSVIDAAGSLAMPGVIDCHVHFREPGLTHKADIASESRAAVAGGVTSYFDMPNTKPQTTTIEAWREKCELAQGRSMANYAFYIGATNDNIDQLVRAPYDRIPGVKLFMGSSTGNMLVDRQDRIRDIFTQLPSDIIISVHAEDQDIIASNTKAARERYADAVPVAMHSAIRSTDACVKCSARAVDIARDTDHRLNLCHVSTSDELPLRDSAPGLVTLEVSPHHLMWCDEDYERKGTLIKMNPAVKSRPHRDALRRAVAEGRIDLIATDHAPHMLSEKRGDALTATSGAPLVQYSLPWMLTAFHEVRVQQLMCENPAKIFGIVDRGRLEPGCYADITLVRTLDRPEPIAPESCLSKCGWSPAIGVPVTRQVTHTWVNGSLVYADGRIIADKPAGMPLTFDRTQR